MSAFQLDGLSKGPKMKYPRESCSFHGIQESIWGKLPKRNRRDILMSFFFFCHEVSKSCTKFTK